ncbi:PRC-barrel domain-containing protein [Stieleria varia]|uniref:PRC-barrel domain protein n=1 Tax=Stieleria varia TaxID=2528005 RepID=A0A5C6BB78_9BACT|nr:PRC-barrel domain-containing protein [Stieleria varia]TWU08516.1 PRC-barrel domain protein [Stieleria varia]
MKRTSQFLSALTAIACLTSTTATAQDTTRERTRPKVDAGKLDAKTQGANIRVSQLMGYNIQNSQGESVGEIKDVVINSRTGKVEYAAVTYGGFLGVGNKLFAVPFAAFKVQVDPDEAGDDDVDSDDYVLVLNVTQQQLEGQQGFDEDNWPNMADRQWAADLDKRYGVKRNMDAKDRLMKNNRERNLNQ